MRLERFDRFLVDARSTCWIFMSSLLPFSGLGYYIFKGQSFIVQESFFTAETFRIPLFLQRFQGEEIMLLSVFAV